jgi:hypothetical protein
MSTSKGKSIVRKNVTATDTAEEAPKRRYGKRFITIRGRSIIADYHPDDTVSLYVTEEQSKTLLPVVAGVPREKAKETAKLIAGLMDSYEGLLTKGAVTIDLTVK